VASGSKTKVDIPDRQVMIVSWLFRGPGVIISSYGTLAYSGERSVIQGRREVWAMRYGFGDYLLGG